MMSLWWWCRYLPIDGLIDCNMVHSVVLLTQHVYDTLVTYQMPWRERTKTLDTVKNSWKPIQCKHVYQYCYWYRVTMLFQVHCKNSFSFKMDMSYKMSWPIQSLHSGQTILYWAASQYRLPASCMAPCYSKNSSVIWLVSLRQAHWSLAL